MRFAVAMGLSALAGCGSPKASYVAEPPTAGVNAGSDRDGVEDAGSHPGFALDGAAGRGSGDGGASAASRNPAARFEAKVAELMDRARVPGLSVAVVRRGGAAWSGAYGFADTPTQRRVDADTRFVAASVSKTLLAVEVLRLVDGAQLGLDDDVRPLVPYPLAHRWFPTAPITVRHLLTHTSSLRDTWSVLASVMQVGDDAAITATDFHRDYFSPGGRFFSDGNFGDASPGTTWEYSNIAFGVLADVIASKTRKAFWEHCRDDLLVPLGITDATYFVSEVPASNLALPHVWNGSSYVQPGTRSYPDYAVGTLYVSSKSLGRFLAALLETSPSGPRLLASPTLDDMLHVQVPSASSRQGLGFTLLSLPRKGLVWGHTGSLLGSGAVVALDPFAGTAVAILVNGDVFANDPAGVAAVAELTDLLFDVASGL